MSNSGCRLGKCTLSFSLPWKARSNLWRMSLGCFVYICRWRSNKGHGNKYGHPGNQTGTDLIQSIRTNQEGDHSFGHGIDGPSNGWGLLYAINRWLISALVGTPLMWRTKASYWVTQVRIDDAWNQGLREVKRRKTLFFSPKGKPAAF